MLSNVIGRYIGVTGSATILLPAGRSGEELNMTGAGFPLIVDPAMTSHCSKILLTFKIFVIFSPTNSFGPI